MPDKTLSNATERTAREIRIDWPRFGPVGTLAQHAVIQFDGEMFYLNFFQISPPIIMDAEERQETIKEMKSIAPKPVAQIIIPKSNIRGFAAALQQQVSQLDELDK